MRIAINLAGTTIGITFLDQTQEIGPVYAFMYTDFISRAKETDASIQVDLLPSSMDEPSLSAIEREGQIERVLSNRIVEKWFSKGGRSPESYSLDTRTISTWYLNGLLLYSPDTLSGKIYLSTRVEDPFLGLYRLLWVFFAQVLGEKGACFLHAAALVQKEKGFLFIGHSGAGKSTLSRESTDCQVFSDEAPIVVHQDALYRVYPSPFHQMDPIDFTGSRVSSRTAVIQGFYFLIQDERTFVQNLSKRVALGIIVSRQIHFFHCLSPAARIRLFYLFSDACSVLPVRDFHFCRGKYIWEVLD